MNTVIVDAGFGGDASLGYVSLPQEGKGPGLVLLTDPTIDAEWAVQTARLMAEEGYVTLAVPSPSESNLSTRWVELIEQAARALERHPAVDGPVGLLGYGSEASLVYAALARTSILKCAVLYSPSPGVDEASLNPSAAPVTIHCGEREAALPGGAGLLARLRQSRNTLLYQYPIAGSGFAYQGSPAYSRPAAMMAYSRTIGALRKYLGPVIDIESLWETHLSYEFGTKDPDATIKTMVEDAYVNHIPNMTGGVGREYLYRFYKYHFIPRTPDVELIPVSRTIGADRIVDEFISVFTHDREMDWFLPGIPATGKRVEIPCVSIVCFRGRKLYHEHIYWDQASVLVQLGLLDPAKLPIAGRESALKVMDNSRPSNELMRSWKNSEGLK